MRKTLIAGIVFVFFILAGLSILSAQDIPVPCFPCEPEPIGGCSQCHTW